MKHQFIYFPIVVLLAFSCNDKKEQSIVNKNQETHTNTETINESQRDTIVIRQMKFQPSELKVSKGKTIVWVNKDLVAHDITKINETTSLSDNIHPNQTWQMKVDESFDYQCSIHPTMQAKIKVE